MTEFEHKKNCACRKVWDMRNQNTPKAEQYNMKFTWADWFLQMFGESIEAVHGRLNVRAS